MTFALEIYIALAALALFFLSLANPRPGVPRRLALALAAVGVVASWWTFGARGDLFHGTYRVDAFSQSFKFIIAWQNLANGDIGLGASGTKYIVGASASTPGNLIIGANARAYNAIVTVTDAACISVNFALSNNFLVTLGGNRTLKAPTNCTVGQGGSIYFIQDIFSMFQSYSL